MQRSHELRSSTNRLSAPRRAHPSPRPCMAWASSRLFRREASRETVLDRRTASGKAAPVPSVASRQPVRLTPRACSSAHACERRGRRYPEPADQEVPGVSEQWKRRGRGPGRGLRQPWPRDEALVESILNAHGPDDCNQSPREPRRRASIRSHTTFAVQPHYYRSNAAAARSRIPEASGRQLPM